MSGTRRVPAWLAGLMLAVLVAACSNGGGTATPRSTAPAITGSGTLPTLGPIGSQPPASTRPSKAPATAAGSGSGSGLGSAKPFRTKNPAATPRPIVAFHGATDLEAVVPARAGAATLVIESVQGSGFNDLRKHKAGIRCRWYEGRGLRCRQQKELDAVLAKLGRTRTDVTMAVGYNPTRGGAEVQVMRVAGVTGGELRDAVLSILTDAAAKTKHPLDIQTASVGGRDVRVINATKAYPLGKQRWFYASGDALYEIRQVDEATAGQIVVSLP